MLANLPRTLEEIGFWHRTTQEKNILLMQKDAEKRRKALKATKSKWGDLAEITFPAFNPDKFLTWLHSYTYWIYTWWFTCITLVFFGVMIGITVTHWSEIGRDTLQFYKFTDKTWGDVGGLLRQRRSSPCAGTRPVTATRRSTMAAASPRWDSSSFT